MKCSSCGKADLVHETRDIPYSYKGESTLIKGITADYCPNCDEFEMDEVEGDRFSALMLDFNKQVNAKIFDSNFILHIRNKLGLDQKKAAEIFGGGVNAFSRYERGVSRPPKSLLQLFKILDHNPHLMSIISGDKSSSKPKVEVHSRQASEHGSFYHWFTKFSKSTFENHTFTVSHKNFIDIAELNSSADYSSRNASGEIAGSDVFKKLREAEEPQPNKSKPAKGNVINITPRLRAG